MRKRMMRVTAILISISYERPYSSLLALGTVLVISLGNDFDLFFYFFDNHLHKKIKRIQLSKLAYLCQESLL